MRLSADPEPTRDKMKGLLCVLLAVTMIATISAGPVHKVCFIVINPKILFRVRLRKQ